MSLTINEMQALAINDFKRKIPRDQKELADMVDKVFKLGMETGIQIGKAQTHNNFMEVDD